MLGLVVVLFGDEYTLLEDVLVDRLAVGLGDKPVRGLVGWPQCGWTEGLHCRESLALFGRSRTMREVGCVEVLCGWRWWETCPSTARE